MQQILGILSAVSQDAARLEPMLQEVHPKDWITKGAPETYAIQWDSAVKQVRGIEQDMTALAQHPDQLTDCMRALFRAESLHITLDSLMGGLRKYQNAALAELIQSVAAENEGNLEKFRSYLLDLVKQKDEEFKVIDHEAQRCRANLSRDPAPARRPVR